MNKNELFKINDCLSALPFKDSLLKLLIQVQWLKVYKFGFVIHCSKVPNKRVSRKNL